MSIFFYAGCDFSFTLLNTLLVSLLSSLPLFFGLQPVNQYSKMPSAIGALMQSCEEVGISRTLTSCSVVDRGNAVKSHKRKTSLLDRETAGI